TGSRKNKTSAATAVRERATTFMNCNPSRSSSQTTVRKERKSRRQTIRGRNTRVQLRTALGSRPASFVLVHKKPAAICTDTRAHSVCRRFLRRTGETCSLLLAFAGGEPSDEAAL